MPVSPLTLANAQYNPIGVDYPDNLRAGEFQLKGVNSTAFGIPIGNPMVYTFLPKAGQAVISAQTVASNGYFLLNQPLVAGSGATIVPDTSLLLDCERAISITNPTGAFSCLISGYDRYKQKVVVTGAATGSGPYTFLTLGGLSEIISIFIYGAAGNYAYTLNTLNQFEMPFANATTNPYGGTFLNPQTTTNAATGAARPFIVTNIGGAQPQAFRNFGWGWGVALVGQPNINYRPMMGLTTAPVGIITIEMQAESYGFEWMLKSRFSSQPNQGPDNNSLSKVIGITPYKTGWTPWKG